MSKRSAKKEGRIDAEPVFILHQYAYRETSLILDIFSQTYGRLSVIARGARRAGSSLRGILMAFQPIVVSWFGLNELKTLHRAEWQGGVPYLSGLPLLCGFYMNELLMKLLPKDEPTGVLFAVYFKSISRLAKMKEKEAVETILREFELTLLSELGYGFNLQYEYATGKEIKADKNYQFMPGCGFIPHQNENALPLCGETLLNLAQKNFSCPKTRQQSKSLMREALAYELGGAVLHTRKILLDLHLLS